MMSTWFISAVSLLVLSVLLHAAERRRGRRYIPVVRRFLDHGTTWVAHRAVNGFRRSRQYISREVIVKLLHMVVYLVQVGVRVCDRKLTRTMLRLRSVGKKRNSTIDEHTSNRRSTGDGL